MSKYRDFEFEVTTRHGKIMFRCRAKTEAAALAARDRYAERFNVPQKPLTERLNLRRLA